MSTNSSNMIQLGGMVSPPGIITSQPEIQGALVEPTNVKLQQHLPIIQTGYTTNFISQENEQRTLAINAAFRTRIQGYTGN